MKKDTIKHIFFDLDHTLWDFDRNSNLAFQRVFDKHNIAISLPEFLEVYEPINFNYWALFRLDKVTKQELRRGRLRDSFAPLGYTYSNQELDLLATSYIDELPKDNFLFDGAIQLLEYLKIDYALHIITNGFDDVQKLKIKNSGIELFFDTVTTSEEVGVKKPNPLIFNEAMSKANAVPSNSIMIGDTYEADIKGAEDVGMHTLFYNYRNQKLPNKYITVDTLEEIKLYL